jgi:hypothetical protein
VKQTNLFLLLQRSEFKQEFGAVGPQPGRHSQVCMCTSHNRETGMHYLYIPWTIAPFVFEPLCICARTSEMKYSNKQAKKVVRR